MRELKFRAWNRKDSKMVLLDGIQGNMGFITTSGYNIWHELKYVMQYIGFEDNNGVEIYDEDIIEFYEGDTLVKGEIEWLQEECCFVARVPGEIEQHYVGLSGDEKLSCTIIGNMYENKNLLDV